MPFHFQEVYKRKGSKILQWKCLKGHNGLSKPRRMGPLKGNVSLAEVETRENKRGKSFLRSFFFLFFCCFFFLFLRCYFSLLGLTIFLTRSFSRRNVVIESRNGSFDLLALFFSNFLITLPMNPDQFLLLVL